MSEDDTTPGKRGDEIRAGYMPVSPEPTARPDAPAYVGEKGVQDAAAEIGSRRPATEQPTEIKIVNKQTGERFDRPVAYSAESAAQVLGDVHRDQAKNAEFDVDLWLATELARDELAPQQPQQPQESAQQPQEQPERSQQPTQPTQEPHERPADGLDPRIREALEIPEIRAAIEQQIGEAQRTRDAYAQAIDHSHRLAAASVLSTVPELQGMQLEMVPGALAMLAQNNPQRHAQVMHQIEAVNTLHQRSAAVQADNARQAAEQQQQHFDKWAAEQDAAFDKQFAAEFSDPQKALQARSNVRTYLNAVGIPDDVLPQLWKTDLFRDAKAQRIIYDAACWNAAKEKAKSAERADVPQVQRPGVSNGYRPDNSVRVERLQSNLRNASGPAAARAAAKLMQAKRAG